MKVAIPDASERASERATKSCRRKLDLVLFLERQNFIARDGACAKVKSPHGEKHVREFTEDWFLNCICFAVTARFSKDKF